MQSNKHDTDYRELKDLLRRTASFNVLRDKVYNIAKNPKFNGYQRGIGSIVFNYFDKKSSGVYTSSVVINSGIMSNQQLAKGLHKPVIRTFRKGKVCLYFKDNILGADFLDKQLISKYILKKVFYYVVLIFLVNMHGLFL